MFTKQDPDIIQAYFEDHSGLLGGHAERVVIPESTEEVSDLLRSASERRVPVTVSGAGTGVTGGRVPFGGTVLSLENLNRVLGLRRLSGDRSAVRLQAGVTVAELKRFAASEGWMYPPDPTELNSFIGGNTATNASGSRGFRYGPTRGYINALTVVLSSGDVLELSRGRIKAGADRTIALPLPGGTRTLTLPRYALPDIKNAAGYCNAPGMDLVDLFIGQEGTLGVVTELEVLLEPRIEGILSGVAFFPERALAWECVREIKDLTRRTDGDASVISALALEYLDEHALALLRPDYPNIPGFARAALFFEQDLTGRNETRAMEAWAEVLERYHVPIDEVWFAAAPKEQEGFREFRHRLPERVNEIVRRNRFPKVGTDLAVPDERFREMLEFYETKFNDSGIPHLVFGHIGENHLHANLLPATEDAFRKSRQLYLELARKAVELGGTVSAEHGIGKLKHAFLECLVGREGLSEMARFKRAVDPPGILGQGNIFPEELLRE